MSRWFVVLMIALLPLRGWVGEAMAGQMIAQQLAAVAQATTPADDAATGAHTDCHGQVTADAPPAAEASSSMDCGSCTSCQVCHSVAMAAPALTAAAPLQPHPALPAYGRQFASAERSPGFKPPIS